MIIKDKIIPINKKKHIAISELKLPSCGIIGISGNSGSGKSTLLNHIHSGLLSKYFGNDISYIAQENLLFDHLTIKQNMIFQLSLVDKEYNDENPLLKDFHITHLLKKKPKHLSIGEKQRVNFVIQMLRDTSIILLDEPTASLNDQYIAIMKDYLLKQKDHSLIILTSHNPSMFEICDSIYKIENNKLILIKENQNSSFETVNRKMSFSVRSCFQIKSKRKIFQQFPIYLVIALICTGLTLMHSIKYQELDYQKNLLHRLNPNEILLKNTIDPLGGDASYYNCLPISSNDYKQLQEIDNISIYPVYYVSNEDESWETSTITCYEDTDSYSFDEKIVLVPYFDTDWLKDNLIDGEIKEDGIYINKRIEMFYDPEFDFSKHEYQIDVDVMIPTHYELVEGTYEILDDPESYIWYDAWLYGTFTDFNHSIDGIINEDYRRASGAQIECYVPYDMLDQMVKKYQTNEEKEFYSNSLKPYTFGAAYIEVGDFENMEEIDRKIQSISSSFQTQYGYHDQAKNLQVFQNFKNEIDLFEYAGFIFFLLLGIGYWNARKRSDSITKHKLDMLKLSKRQYRLFYLVETITDVMIILLLTLMMSLISFEIILQLGELLVYDQNATIAALVTSIIVSAIIKLFVERKLLHD